MANKTTTQEVDGGYAATGDLFRIARGGTNYKLETESIFLETITQIELIARATANTLIGGRNYIVTGSGPGSAFTIMITATGPNTYTTANNLVGSGASTSGCMVAMDPALSELNCVIDTAGNIIQTGGSTYQAKKSVLTGLTYYNNTSGNGAQYCHLVGGTYSLANSEIYYSTITNSTIISDGTGGGISGCNISGCTIYLNNGASLSQCTIIGDAVSGCTYVFDGITLANATIIAGSYSSAEYVVRSGQDFDPPTNTLTLPPNVDWVGTFLLENFSSGDTLEYINGTTNSFQSHTPVKFKNNSTVVIETIHINNPSSSAGTGQIMFPHHHGTNDDLHTDYSYLLGKFDAIQNLWPITEYTDYV